MRLIFMLNKDIPLGRSINAVAHMAVGIGHRMNGTPRIEAYFGNTQRVREFRALTNKIAQSHKVVVSDFTDTMTEETAKEQLIKTRATVERNLNYFAACIVAPAELTQPLFELLDGCDQLAKYQPSAVINSCDILPPQNVTLPTVAPDKKLAMVINKKAPLGTLLNDMIVSCLQVGKRANLTDLHLLDFVDNDNNAHSNISYHPFPILTAANASKHTQMANNADSAAALVAQSQRISNEPFVTVVFGDRQNVDAVILRQHTSLYRAELNPQDLIKASIPKPVTQLPADPELLGRNSFFSSPKVTNQAANSAVNTQTTAVNSESAGAAAAASPASNSSETIEPSGTNVKVHWFLS